VVQTPYAELHCHTNFSFLDGASPADDLVERAVELGLTGLAVTDHAGLYGAVRLSKAADQTRTDDAREAGLTPVTAIIGIELTIPQSLARYCVTKGSRPRCGTSKTGSTR